MGGYIFYLHIHTQNSIFVCILICMCYVLYLQRVKLYLRIYITLLHVCIHMKKLTKLKKEPNLQNEMLTEDQSGGKNKTSIYLKKSHAVQNSIDKDNSLRAPKEKSQATYKGMRIILTCQQQFCKRKDNKAVSSSSEEIIS